MKQQYHINTFMNLGCDIICVRRTTYFRSTKLQLSVTVVKYCMQSIYKTTIGVMHDALSRMMRGMSYVM